MRLCFKHSQNCVLKNSPAVFLLSAIGFSEQGLEDGSYFGSGNVYDTQRFYQVENITCLNDGIFLCRLIFILSAA